MTTRAKTVTEPVLRFKFPRQGESPERTIELWVYDAGQFCQLPGYKHALGGEKTGGVVYVTSDCNGYRWEESHLEQASVWQWIGEWMNKGFTAEGLMGGTSLLETLRYMVETACPVGERDSLPNSVVNGLSLCEAAIAKATEQKGKVGT